MALPILHSFAGYSIFKASKSNPSSPKTAGLWMLGSVALANLPDLDFIPGILMGEADRFHHGFSHSLFAGLIVGLFLGLIAHFFMKRSFIKSSCLTATLYLSHIFLDFINGVGPVKHESGIPIFWPLTNQKFATPISLIPTGGYFQKATNLGEFIRGLFEPSCIRRATSEIVILMSILVFLKGFVLFRNRQPLEGTVLASTAVLLRGLWVIATTHYFI